MAKSKSSSITPFLSEWVKFNIIVSNSFIELRAGISYGKAIIRLDPDFKNNIIIGKPIVESYISEGNQKWMGIGFHNSMTSFLEDNSFTFIETYKIPVKSKNKKYKLSNYTVSWIDCNMVIYSENFFDNWKTSNRKERRYRRNTRKFYEKYKESAPPLRGAGGTLLVS